MGFLWLLLYVSLTEESFALLKGFDHCLLVDQSDLSPADKVELKNDCYMNMAYDEKSLEPCERVSEKERFKCIWGVAVARKEPEICFKVPLSTRFDPPEMNRWYCLIELKRCDLIKDKTWQQKCQSSSRGHNSFWRR